MERRSFAEAVCIGVFPTQRRGVAEVRSWMDCSCVLPGSGRQGDSAARPRRFLLQTIDWYLTVGMSRS